MAGVMPLDGVRIIDLTSYTAGPFCTRVLADYGADVIKVEPPGGDPGRLLPPFLQDRMGVDRSGLFLFLNTNKRSVMLNLKTLRGRQQLLSLTRDAQVIVESFRPGTLDRLEIGYDTLRAINPRLVLTSLTNFGQDGPYRDYQGVDLTLFAMGGPMIGSGEAQHEPLKNAGRATTFHAGYVAALATMIALRGAELNGEGEHVDVSVFEAATHSIDLRLSRLLAYQYSGSFRGRPQLASTVGSGVFPCADGFYMLTAGAQRLEGLIRMIGHEELLRLPEWATVEARMHPDRVEQFSAYLIPWTIERTKQQILRACKEHGVMGAPINTVADLLEDENFRERKFFQHIDHPETGPLVYPGYHFTLHRPEGPMPPRRRAPLLGEHNAELLDDARSQPAPPLPGAPRYRARLPLAGLRILDFTVVLAGPYGAMQLADWGAEVIRVESLQHFPMSTRGAMARPPAAVVTAQTNSPAGFAYPDNDPGPRPWNRVSAFNHHSRNKLAMTVDLRRPEGQQVLERLVAVSDGVIENNVPETIEKQGVSWERFSRINPRLIMVRVPGYGLTGPYRGLRSMGMHMEAFAGHPAIRTYSNLSYEYIPLGVPSDAAGGIGAALAFMMGLRYRELTGQGLQVESATAENFVPFLGDFVMDYSMNGRLWSQMGNDHFWMAPHNVYPCRGDDRWVTIACRNDQEWRRLCEVMRRPELAKDSRFEGQPQRYANRRELDGLIGEWTRLREPFWVMHRLQGLGIPAGVVMTEADVFENPHLLARDFFQQVAHPEAGTHTQVRGAWRASKTPLPTARHAPCLGEDNEYVYRELLSFSAQEYHRFEELGHIGREYDASVP